MIMHCEYCGHKNEPDIHYCIKCGKSLDEKSEKYKAVTEQYHSGPQPATQPTPYTAPKRLVRCSNDKVIAGLCSG